MADTPRPSMPSSFKGINHLKLPCHSLKKTHDFYTRIFPFTPLPQYNHYTPTHALFATMITHAPSNLIVEIRYSPTEASAQKGWDPITWGVGTRKDLEEWGEWLDKENVKRSPVLMGIKSWVMACKDPDGRIVRLFVEDEEHEWTDHPDRDEYWLGSVQGDPEVDAADFV
jgi:hypothetical protein